MHPFNQHSQVGHSPMPSREGLWRGPNTLCMGSKGLEHPVKSQPPYKQRLPSPSGRGLPRSLKPTDAQRTLFKMVPWLRGHVVGPTLWCSR